VALSEAENEGMWSDNLHVKPSRYSPAIRKKSPFKTSVSGKRRGREKGSGEVRKMLARTQNVHHVTTVVSTPIQLSHC
jgi:hypothetical protein